jgi:hypothetical protein
MPARRNAAPSSVEPASTSTSVATLPADIRADLLRAQADMVGSESVRFPQVKVMPAGAGLFEFKDSNDTVRDFVGVILMSHGRNILWDKKFGSPESRDADGNTRPPACVSNDAVTASPRPGFAHLALQRQGLPTIEATGQEIIACSSCPYNQWGSKPLLSYVDNPNAKGKACTNQRSVYVLTPDRQVPVELVLPPTSLTPYDEYLRLLLNQSVPVQLVLTRFSQSVGGQGGIRYGTVEFSLAEGLADADVPRVMEVRSRFLNAMTPTSDEYVAPESVTVGDPVVGARAVEEAEEIPF